MGRLYQSRFYSHEMLSNISAAYGLDDILLTILVCVDKIAQL
eukprot:Gb_23385 [translate_table: standard]